MINLARIQKKAADIRGALATLRPLAVRPERDFLADKLVVSAAKYELLVAMEAALDLCGHLCVQSLSKAPAGYADCFELLAAGGVITNETSQRLVRMARFRNLLVHQYGDVDDAQFHRILRDNLKDLDQYLEELGRYLGHHI